MAKKTSSDTTTEEKANGASNGAVQQEAANMPLFYKKPTPLDAKAHSKLGLKKNFGFGFTEGINAVPVNLIEMPQVCHFYPIAFSPDGNATPVAILGLRDNENLFLKSDNTWLENSYVPAYIRRYPFIFSEMPNGDQLTLCVDMDNSIIEEKASSLSLTKTAKQHSFHKMHWNFVNPTMPPLNRRWSSARLWRKAVCSSSVKRKLILPVISVLISPALKLLMNRNLQNLMTRYFLNGAPKAGCLLSMHICFPVLNGSVLPLCLINRLKKRLHKLLLIFHLNQPFGYSY